MSPDDLAETLDTFAAYRGSRLDAGSPEAREFVAIFGGARAEDVRDAIRQAAERDGRVFLETVARRHGEIRSERFQAAGRDREAAKRPAPTETSRPGWPVAPGEPVTSYLAAVAWLAIDSVVIARRAAAKFAAAGLLLPEFADRVLDAMGPVCCMPPANRAEAAKAVQEDIDRDLGAWGRCPAEQFIQQFWRAA